MTDLLQTNFPRITVTIPVGCNMTGWRHTKMRELINSGEIVAIKVGRKTLIKVDSLRAFIDRQPAIKAA